MVATVGVQEMNGTTPTYTDLTSARYCTNDDAAPALTNPIPIPTSNFNWSFWKSHTLVMSGSFTQINNIRWYTDGTIGWNLGTSGKLYIAKRASGDVGCPVSNYYQASGTVGTTGTMATSGHQYYKIGSGISGALVLASQYIVGSPATVDSTNYASQGAKSKAVVTQVSVDTDATQGTQSAETVTFRYDEI